MTENVLVTITGHHLAGGENDSIQTVQPGIYRFIDQKHVIRYEEILEDSIPGPPVSAQCLIKITPDSVTLIKKGEAQTEMFFQKNSTFESIYHTPLGLLHLSIHTTRLELNETGDRICAKLDYNLEMEGTLVSRCSIQIEVTALKKTEKTGAPCC